MLEAPSFSPRPDAEALRDETWVAPLQILRRHRVDHVIAGDAAAAAYGLPVPALAPLAIVPALYERNLDRLTAARRELKAAGATVDVLHRPAGTDGYRDLHDDARPVRIAPDLEVLVASSEDLARMREAAAA